MNYRWCLWSTPFCEEFCNRLYCVRCYFAVCQLCFPFFKCFFRTILLIFRVTQFTGVLRAGSLVSCHNFLNFLLCFSEWSKRGISYFLSKVVVFLADILYTEAIGAAKSRDIISFIRRANWGIWRLEFRGEALKQLPVCQYFNWIYNFPRSNRVWNTKHYL
jgi:hypothetical protein